MNLSSLNTAAVAAWLLISLPAAAQDLGVFSANRDIGSPKLTGSASYDSSNETFRVVGAGANMWSDHDAFHYLYTRVAGNFTAEADFDFIAEGVNAHRKTGWVVRESLDPDAAMINATVHGDGLVSLQFRLAAGEQTRERKFVATHAHKISLERTDHNYIMRIEDREGRRARESIAIDLGQSLYLGVYTCSHDDDVREEVVVSNLKIEAGHQFFPLGNIGALRWRNIGPANMMGRIASIDALDVDHRQVLVGTASGGVYKSTNAGLTWEVIFDKYGASSIGSAVMHQQHPNIIWVGTGESANRNSSGWGNGIFKSHDGGKSFRCMGLEDGHHIAEIALHPTDTNHLYAAVVGHLWGYKGSRGLFESHDGGQSWSKVGGGLPDDGKTGCTEIVMHPQDPNVLYAGFYHRLRQPASFQSGGEEGGLYKSTDAGRTWKKITSGLADGPSGMIDISIHLADPDIMVMAYEAEEALNLVKDSIGNPVPGSGVYKSMDGGEHWQFLLPHTVRPFYHGQICIDPIDPENIYVVSRGFKESHDGGETFVDRRSRTDGGDDHDMWIAPYDNKYMYIATDQGFRYSNDGGKNWLSHNNMAIGQYYAIGVDMADPYHVAGGLQDNGLWVAATNSRNPVGILNRDNYWIGEGDGFHVQIDPSDPRTIYMVNHVGFCARLNAQTREYQYITPTPETTVNFADHFDPAYPETRNIYTIDPGEHWFFYEDLDRPLLPPQFRFNWSSPLVMSPTNSNTIYFGSNHLFKSTDRGDTWRIISHDLTTNDSLLRNTSNGGGLTFSNTGGENHFTIITIAESPIDPATVWVGTDDGNVQVTRDGGASWTNVKDNIAGIPEKIWVSRVEASRFHRGTAYVTFDNHRYDDFNAYIYKTTDYGNTWQDISANLSDQYSLYVVREDIVNPNLLFVGSESSVHFSSDGGAHWHLLDGNLPSVAVHDLVIHPRDGDLVAGTHGRSIWILDDLSPLRQWDSTILEKDFHLFKPRRATQWQRVYIGRTQPAFEFRGENPPGGALLDVFVADAKLKDINISITDIAGMEVAQWEEKVVEGFNRFSWDMLVTPHSAEVAAVKGALVSTCSHLRTEIVGQGERTKLDEILTEIKGADSMKSLNQARELLVNQFAGYAGGESIFAHKLMKRLVAPGEYLVQVKGGALELSTTLEIRRDPVLEKN